MADIFISYSRKDFSRVRTLAEKLQKHGFDVWWDSNILHGESFRNVIEEELKTAKCIVVVWSENSVNSDWVLDESTHGKNNNILVPLLIDNVEIPLGFQSIQTANFVSLDLEKDSSHPEWNKLLKSIIKVSKKNLKENDKISPKIQKNQENNEKTKNTKWLITSIIAIIGTIITPIIIVFLQEQLKVKVYPKFIIVNPILYGSNIIEIEAENEDANHNMPLTVEFDGIKFSGKGTPEKKSLKKQRWKFEIPNSLFKEGKHKIRVGFHGKRLSDTLVCEIKTTIVVTAVTAVKSKPIVTKEIKPKPIRFFNSLGIEFVLVKAGSFNMGSPLDEPGRNDDEKQHSVIIDNDFYMQTTEVTQEQWKKIMDYNHSKFKCNDCPVENISWNEANQFIKKLNEKEGTDLYELPEEKQWEYACRAGTDTAFYFGKCLSTREASYDGSFPLSGCDKGNFSVKTVPVKNFAPNSWGLYGMHGNVEEWCLDWYSKKYMSIDPKDEQGGKHRVYKGGSWKSEAKYCRSAYRGQDSPISCSKSRGFRIVKKISKKNK